MIHLKGKIEKEKQIDRRASRRADYLRQRRGPYLLEKAKVSVIQVREEMKTNLECRIIEVGDMDLNFSINKNIESLLMFILDQSVRNEDCKRIRKMMRKRDEG